MNKYKSTIYTRNFCFTYCWIDFDYFSKVWNTFPSKYSRIDIKFIHKTLLYRLQIIEIHLTVDYLLLLIDCFGQNSNVALTY